MLFIKESPFDLYDVITQISRHILNKTLNLSDIKFLEKFKATFYLLALPSTTLKNKNKILALQSFEFFKQILIVIQKEILAKNVS